MKSKEFIKEWGAIELDTCKKYHTAPLEGEPIESCYLGRVVTLSSPQGPYPTISEYTPVSTASEMISGEGCAPEKGMWAVGEAYSFFMNGVQKKISLDVREWTSLSSSTQREKRTFDLMLNFRNWNFSPMPTVFLYIHYFFLLS